MRSWEKFIPRTDLEIHAAARYGTPIGLGTRPAALIIDVNYRFVARHPEPVLRSVALRPVRAFLDDDTGRCACVLGA